MEINKLSFPSKDRMLSFLKGASGGMESHPLGACLEYLPNHADRSFQAFHEGLFRLGKIVQTARTFVNDTAPMMLCCISRMILKDRRFACWARDLEQFHVIDLISGCIGSMMI